MTQVDPDAALDFLTYVQERHRVWEQRQAGAPAPWTDEPTVASKKFTNVFRVLDPGSQFVLTDLMEDGLPPEDFALRCFLYRHTGRVEVWEYVNLLTGEYPTSSNLDSQLEAIKEYRGPGVTKRKPPRREGQVGRGNGFQSTPYKRTVFTGAYLVFPQSAERGTDKLDSIFDLTQRLRDNGSFTDMVNAKTQAERFWALRGNRGVADFMSMQVLTDYGYSTEFREDEYVVPGPGARKGSAALSQAPAEQVVEWAVNAIRGLENPPTVGGRLPSYMDAQNCLCEFSKWVRYSQKPVPAKPYQPAHPGAQDIPVLPPLW